MSPELLMTLAAVLGMRPFVRGAVEARKPNYDRIAKLERELLDGEDTDAAA